MSNQEDLFIQIDKNIKLCQKCRLYQNTRNAVPGEGNTNSDLVFVGEAPGEREDATGRPFVGRAGMLLESSLKKIGLTRQDIWIGNIIKHRPPENRDPLPDEIESCIPFLKMQLKAINPKLIVTLGRFSMNFFYPDGKISKDHGKLIKLAPFSIYPVYHPAAALRNGSMMLEFNKDFIRIPEVLKRIKSDPLVEVEPFKVEDSPDGQLVLKF